MWSEQHERRLHTEVELLPVSHVSATTAPAPGADSRHAELGMKRLGCRLVFSAMAAAGYQSRVIHLPCTWAVGLRNVRLRSTLSGGADMLCACAVYLPATTALHGAGFRATAINLF